MNGLYLFKLVVIVKKEIMHKLRFKINRCRRDSFLALS